MNRQLFTTLALTGCLFIASGLIAPLPAQDTAPAAAATEKAASAPPAVTTGDTNIPLDHLKLMLDPLTKDELLVEAEGWRDLVKAKVQALAEQEIATRTKRQEVDEAETAAEGAETTAPQEVAVLEQEKDTKIEEKKESVDAATELRTEKMALLERLGVVLDAYEAKGGDGEEFRKYATVVSGLQVDVTDAHATWSAVHGWLVSNDGGIKWGLRIAQFLGLMLVFWILSLIIGKIVRKTISMQTSISGLLKHFIEKIVERVVLFVGFLIALSSLGVNVGALLALIGGGAFIVGFALQDSLGNFAAGVMLLIYRPFDVGDAVEVGGVVGKVDRVSLVSTTIRTFDNKVVLVPNKQVWGQVITNATASDQRRVDLVFGIGYNDDIDKAQKVLEDIVAGHEKVLADPAPVVQLNELADSSVNFICRPWCATSDYWTVYWDVTREVKKRFDASGISIPFPQSDVHVHQAS